MPALNQSFKIVGEVAVNRDFFISNRVSKINCFAMKRLPVNLSAVTAVKRVTQKGRTEMGKMHPYLMSSSRFKVPVMSVGQKMRQILKLTAAKPNFIGRALVLIIKIGSHAIGTEFLECFPVTKTMLQLLCGRSVTNHTAI